MKADHFIELQDLPQDRLNRLAETPSSGLGSSRDKPDVEYCKKVIDVLEKKNVRYFFYIGGNDSSDTCRIINEEAGKHGYELRAFHVPKTIDNDLMVNDHTPGYGSAAKFVAQAFQGDNLDNKALPGVKINIVMGRHAGFLTAAAMLGKAHDEDGPHLVYVPEATFEEDKFAADIDGVLKKHGRCLIAVSEGIHDAEGSPMITKLQKNVEKDEHGNKLREDGVVVIPGRKQPTPYRTAAQLMDVLAGSDRVAETLTWKLTQYALGRPLLEADAPALAKIHARATAGASRDGAGTYQRTIVAIVTSDLVAEQGDDLYPAYLADGRIVFTSNRQRQAREMLINEMLKARLKENPRARKLTGVRLSISRTMSRRARC